MEGDISEIEGQIKEIEISTHALTWRATLLHLIFDL